MTGHSTSVVHNSWDVAMKEKKNAHYKFATSSKGLIHQSLSKVVLCKRFLMTNQTKMFHQSYKVSVTDYVDKCQSRKLPSMFMTKMIYI